MFPTFSAPPRANPKSSGLKRLRQGFSLVEVVIAIGIVSFALLSVLGVMTMAMKVHQDASVDSVFSLMTESALQELRNYNTPVNSLSSSTTSAYSFTKLGSYSSAAPGYLYFDQDGQITADAYWTGVNSAGVPTISASTTSANQSTEVGINMSGTTLAANGGKSGVPLSSALTPPPAASYYTCQITAIQPTLTTGTTTSMYIIKLTFSWPPNVATQQTRTVFASISNNTN